MTTPSPRLELIGVSKQFPGVKANDGVHLAVAPGEIHAVLGENGAGKSTLMKIVHGTVAPDEGEIRWDGVRLRQYGPDAARGLGIAMVFQHFSLFDTLTVAENVWLGQERSIGLTEVRARLRALMDEYGLALDPERPVYSLEVGERQRVEILRALLSRPKLLILDEPTSVLTPQAALGLFAVVRQLSRGGCSVLYISHKLDEVRALCHRCTVLRRGRVVATLEPSGETDASLSRLMIGEDPPVVNRSEATAGPVALRVKGLSLSPPRQDRHGTVLRGVSLTVHAGEIVGIAGVSGNGQSELLAALSGENAAVPAGTVFLVVWVNKWFDPPKEAEGAQTLLNDGADVLMQNTDSSAVLQTAEKAGKMAFGWDSDMSKYGPSAHLASAAINWGPYYKKAVKDVLAGTWSTGQSWWGVKEGAIDVVSISDKVSPEAKQKVEAAKAGLRDGSFHIWTGPIFDQSGKEVLKAGQVADDRFLLGITFYVKGVNGKPPASG